MVEVEKRDRAEEGQMEAAVLEVVAAGFVVQRAQEADGDLERAQT